MGFPRTQIETGPHDAPGFHVHIETGRARGALNSVLVVPRDPHHALADALHDLHDPRGAADLDTRLGTLAGRAPEGTAFIVSLEDQAWIFPSERIGVIRRRDGEDEPLDEPQVLRLSRGDELILTERPGKQVVATLIRDVPRAIPVAAETEPEPASPESIVEAPHSPSPVIPTRSAIPPPRRPSRVIAVAGLAVIAISALAVRVLVFRPDASRADAHVAPTLEQRVVDLLTIGGDRSAPGQRVDSTVDDAAAPEDGGAASTKDGPAVAEATPPRQGTTAAVARIPWEFRAQGAITSSPLLLDGALYFGSRDSHLYCLDAATGKVRWSLATETGIGSSPRAAGGLVVVGTYGGEVLAVNRATGKVAWSATTAGRIISSPCVVGNRVIVGSYDGRIHAFDRETGKAAWAHAAGAAVRASGERVGKDGVVIGAGNGRVFHLAADDGSVRWERTLPTAVHAQATWDAGRECVYVGTQGGTAECLAVADGASRWSVAVGSEVNAQPRLTDELVLVGTGRGSLLALDPASGVTRWAARGERGFDACPLVLDATVVAPSFDGTVHVLDLASGEARQSRVVGSEIFSSPAADKGLLYVATMGGTLHALALP